MSARGGPPCINYSFQILPIGCENSGILVIGSCCALTLNHPCCVQHEQQFHNLGSLVQLPYAHLPTYVYMWLIKHLSPILENQEIRTWSSHTIDLKIDTWYFLARRSEILWQGKDRIMWLSGISSHRAGGLVSQRGRTIKSLWVSTYTSRYSSWHALRCY